MQRYEYEALTTSGLVKGWSDMNIARPVKKKNIEIYVENAKMNFLYN